MHQDAGGFTAAELFSQHELESGNIEGIADHIKATGLDYFLVLSGEYGYTLAQSMNPNSYTFGVPSLFTKLYYGESWFQNLSQRSSKSGYRYIREGLFVNMFVSMQSLELYLTDLLLKQGFLRRVCLVPIESSELDPATYKPALSDSRELVWRELDEYVERLVNARSRLLAGPKAKDDLVAVILDKKVEDAINAYDRENHERAITQAKETGGSTGPWNQYAISRWEYLMKFAVLECISEGGHVAMQRHVAKAQGFLDSLEEAQRHVIARIAMGSGGRREISLPTAEWAQRQILESAIKEHEGYFKYGVAQMVLRTTDTRAVAQLLSLIEHNGYAETFIMPDMDREKAKKMLPGSAKSLVPERGSIPVIYKVTDKGRNWIIR